MSHSCDQCGHVFDLHAVIAPGEPVDGGFVLCPTPGCECYATWSVNNMPLSDPTFGGLDIDAIRRKIQE